MCLIFFDQTTWHEKTSTRFEIPTLLAPQTQSLSFDRYLFHLKCMDHVLNCATLLLYSLRDNA
jgi:hypothetical protein